jgi:hypothetical protein
MIVLPAFQSKSNEILLPSNKKELVQLYDANSMKFNDLFLELIPLKYESHEITKYEMFFDRRLKQKFYSITQYFHWSEPYGIYPKTFPL